jgi:hypothetical protein
MEKDHPLRRGTRATLVRLDVELADALEDYRYQLQREQRRRVTKRAVIERALQCLIYGGGTR